jgi:hypothetical protein
MAAAPKKKKKNKKSRETYEICGRHEDGWMSPDSTIDVFEIKPGKLTLELEIPPWLPFKFPLSIKAVQDDEEIAVLHASKPGYRKLRINVREPGVIELSANQWFVPQKLGVSPDTRQICYRVRNDSWGKKSTLVRRFVSHFR